jgi:superfamily II DNA or RNA helicase
MPYEDSFLSAEKLPTNKLNFITNNSNKSSEFGMNLLESQSLDPRIRLQLLKEPLSIEGTTQISDIANSVNKTANELRALRESLSHKQNGTNIDIEDIRDNYPFLYERYESNSRDLEKFQNWVSVVLSLENYIQMQSEQAEAWRGRQATIFEDMAEFVASGGIRGKVVLPTGAGKTVLFIKFVEALNQKTLIVVTTTNILKQTIKKLKEFTPELKYGKVYNLEKNFDEQVTVITYDSLRIGVENGTINPLDYKVMILDEAHLSLGPAAQRTIDKFKNNTLILEFTATDKYSEYKKLTSETIHEMSIVEAVEEGLLAGISCVIAKVSIDLSNVKLDSDNEYDENDFSKAVRDGGVNSACIDLYEKSFNGKTVTIFVSNIEHGEELEDLFNQKYGYGFATSFNGYTKNEEATMQSLESGKTKIVIGVDKLAVGFDLPKASVSFNIVPTASVVRATQRGGRPGRLDPSNLRKIATVIDFIYSDNRSPQHVLYAEVLGSAKALRKTKIIQTNKDKKPNKLLSAYDEYDDDFKVVDIKGLEIIVDQTEIMRVAHAFETVRNEKKQKLTLVEIQEIVKNKGITNTDQYIELSHIDSQIPSYTTLINLDGYTTWHEFLGIETVRLSLNEVKQICKANGIQSSRDYNENYVKLNMNLPSIESLRLLPGWIDWNNLFDKTAKIKHNYIESSNIAIENQIINSLDYSRRASSLNLPHHVELVQMERFTNWNEFLGKEPEYTVEGVVKICVENRITNASQYKKFATSYNKSKEDNYKIAKLPATLKLTNMLTSVTLTDFFKEINSKINVR